MRNIATALALIFLALLPGPALSQPQATATLLNEQAQPSGRQVRPERFFAPQKTLPVVQIQTDPDPLAAVATETLAWLQRHPEAPVTGTVLAAYGISRAEVQKTLQVIVDVVAADKAAHRSSRLLDPDWLAQHFRLLAWSADREGAHKHKVTLPDSRLRITKYVVFAAEGRDQADAAHPCALYALPDEEAQLSPEQAEARKSSLLRYRYTKQQVIAGALKGKAVKPLVWLSRQGLEDALMQGSLQVHMPDGRTRMFNVHRNNGIGYDRRIKDPRQQHRYWYFKEVRGILGYGQDDKIVLQPEVTFAGDVYNIGLGKVVAMLYPGSDGQQRLRLGILADTGGAFVPNLYQLDYLAGVYPSRAAFQKGVAALPTHAQILILIAR